MPWRGSTTGPPARRWLATSPPPGAPGWLLSGGDDPRATRRWEGYCAAALAAGLAEPLRIVLARNAGAVLACAAIAPLAAVDAVFAANDSHAIGLLAGLQTAGRRVPRDIALVGLGDLEMGRLTKPTLSTVRIDGTAIGRAAAALTIGDAPDRRIDLGFELLLREIG